MKKIIIVLCLLISIHANSQKITLDSLNTIIITLQKQVAALQVISWQHTITFAPTQFVVSNTPDTLHQTISLMNASGSEPLAIKDSTAIVNLTNKIAALKATSITTTVIQ